LCPERARHRRSTMGTDSKADRYEQAMKLAEGGRHSEALELVREHLRDHPRDVQGWNDAGAILYCLRRSEEAIEAFERAMKLSGPEVSAEIYWNLVEAYLDAGYPGQAARLFDAMERLGILAADTLNRTADVFLKQENLGGALEMLLRSLEVSCDQEILRPMLEVVRSKRAKVALVASSEDERVSASRRYLEARFPLQVHVRPDALALDGVLQEADIVWLEGLDGPVGEVTWRPKTCRVVVRLRPGEAAREGIEGIAWEQVDVVMVAGETDRRRLIERVAGIEDKTRVVAVPEAVDVRRLACRRRSRGQQIAAIGPWDARSNPMLLLTCMQKLHYIDPGYRLVLAGAFVDAVVERYVRDMVDRMDLGGVVTFEAEPRDWNAWLADKHYVVSAAIDESGMGAVLRAMACGLKPVVHAFPGVEDWIDGGYTFTISEQFCEQVCSEAYDPEAYRRFVEERYGQRRAYRVMNDALYRLEKDPVRKPASADVGAGSVGGATGAPPGLGVAGRMGAVGGMEAPAGSGPIGALPAAGGSLSGAGGSVGGGATAPVGGGSVSEPTFAPLTSGHHPSGPVDSPTTGGDSGPVFTPWTPPEEVPSGLDSSVAGDSSVGSVGLDGSAARSVGSVGSGDSAGRVIPIEPIGGGAMDVPVAGAAGASVGEASPAVSGGEDASERYAAMGRNGVVERMARQALETTRALEAMAQGGAGSAGVEAAGGVGGGAAPTTMPAGPIDSAEVAAGGYDSLESLRQEQAFRQAAQDFVGGLAPSETESSQGAAEGTVEGAGEPSVTEEARAPFVM